MNDTEAMIEMPRYKCHKEVHALKISGFTVNDNGLVLHTASKGYAPLNVTKDWVDRAVRAAKVIDEFGLVGGYYVVYDDGHASYSPAKAFEEGYTRM